MTAGCATNARPCKPLAIPLATQVRCIRRRFAARHGTVRAIMSQATHPVEGLGHEAFRKVGEQIETRMAGGSMTGE